MTLLPSLCIPRIYRLYASHLHSVFINELTLLRSQSDDSILIHVIFLSDGLLSRYFLTSSAFCLLCYRLIDMTDILLRVIFNDIVIKSILVCIRYCTIIVHFGL